VFSGTTWYGIPYDGLLPKSGCTLVPPEPLIAAMYAADRDETGFVEMSVFHALFAGSTAQPPTFGTGAAGGFSALPQVEAIVRRAAPMAKWESRVVTRRVSAVRPEGWSERPLAAAGHGHGQPRIIPPR
jgi:hypothetical protein